MQQAAESIEAPPAGSMTGEEGFRTRGIEKGNLDDASV